MSTPTFLSMFTIYSDPADHPGKFVVREDRVSGVGVLRAAVPHAVVDTLEEARASIPDGLVPLQRHPLDDPVIVESWI